MHSDGKDETSEGISFLSIMQIKLIFFALPDAVSLQEVSPHFWQQWIRLKLVTQAGQGCP